MRGGQGSLSQELPTRNPGTRFRGTDWPPTSLLENVSLDRHKMIQNLPSQTVRELDPRSFGVRKLNLQSEMTRYLVGHSIGQDDARIQT